MDEAEHRQADIRRLMSRISSDRIFGHEDAINDELDDIFDGDSARATKSIHNLLTAGLPLISWQLHILANRWSGQGYGDFALEFEALLRKHAKLL